MKEWNIILPDEQSSLDYARQLAARLAPPMTLSFSGDIGAGKTTLIRAMLRALGIKGAIKSPTYALLESYEGPKGPIHHFDLYRIVSQDELFFLGFREYFAHNTICFIEWPEHAGSVLETVDLAFSLSSHGDGRALQVLAHTLFGEKLMTEVLGR